jgi:hypothetical protein
MVKRGSGTPSPSALPSHVSLMHLRESVSLDGTERIAGDLCWDS